MIFFWYSNAKYNMYFSVNNSTSILSQDMIIWGKINFWY